MITTEESSILSALRHYWNQKGIISEKEMAKALSNFSSNQNPFLQKSLQKDLEENIRKRGIDYDWKNFDYFDFRMSNDKNCFYKAVCNKLATEVCWQCQTEVCEDHIFEFEDSYYCHSCMQDNL